MCQSFCGCDKPVRQKTRQDSGAHLTVEGGHSSRDTEKKGRRFRKHCSTRAHGPKSLAASGRLAPTPPGLGPTHSPSPFRFVLPGTSSRGPRLRKVNAMGTRYLGPRGAGAQQRGGPRRGRSRCLDVSPGTPPTGRPDQTVLPELPLRSR